MQSVRFRNAQILVALFVVAPLAKAEKPQKKEQAIQALIAKIDRRIEARWKQAEVKPAPMASDAEYLRRVYLDVAGRIPSVQEARAFINSRAKNKRRDLMVSLLEKHHNRYVKHFKNVWRQWLIPETNTSFQFQFLAPAFENWLQEELRTNVAYDEMVRKLLTVPLTNGGGQRFGVNQQASPIAFYQVKELKPENIAAATSRLFLGARLECAQCHDHPFAVWTREQFWSYTAFFGGIRSINLRNVFNPAVEEKTKREIAIPGTKKTVKASFLDGSKLEWKKNESSRQKLAQWMTDAKNPYFAKAIVNRFWEYFLGNGLVDPIDEMVGGENEPTHPKVLEELAAGFVEHGYDLKFLIRVITGTRAYQLSSRRTASDQDDITLFARMPLRGLTGEQLFDSIAQATGYQEGGPQPSPFVINNRSARRQFLTKFSGNVGKKTEVQTSILQALSMMNGRVTVTATDLSRSEALAAILDAPFMSTREKIETLVLSTLSRKATDKELQRFMAFVKQQESQGKDRTKAHRQAMADVFWTLLNSSEMMFNH